MSSWPSASIVVEEESSSVSVSHDGARAKGELGLFEYRNEALARKVIREEHAQTARRASMDEMQHTAGFGKRDR